MSREEFTNIIIQLARKAGFNVVIDDLPSSPSGWYSGGYDPEFKTFAKFAELIINENLVPPEPDLDDADDSVIN